jgi:putative membrane protein insertion efficiency factor
MNPFVLLIKAYRLTISPLLGPRCKYYPSCSQYAIDAITEYPIKGFALAAWRLVRCNPWSHGGVDYVVKKDGITLVKNEKVSA